MRDTRFLCRSNINRDFPFDFINGISARLGFLLELLLFNSNPIIPKLHRIFNKFSKMTGRHVAL